MRDAPNTGDILPPQRAHRLLWLVPLALMLFAAGLFGWAALGCRPAFQVGCAVLVAIAATGDALGLVALLHWGRFDSPWRAALPMTVMLGVTFVVAAIAIPNMIGAIDRGRQKRTMGDMRTIATAVEMRAGGRPDYPVVGPEDLDTLARELEPTYLKALPRIDGWGHPIRVESDGRSYTITSYGCCGEQDGAGVHVQPNGGTTTFSADIVFANGSFVKFPDGTQL